MEPPRGPGHRLLASSCLDGISCENCRNLIKRPLVLNSQYGRIPTENPNTQELLSQVPTLSCRRGLKHGNCNVPRFDA